MPKSTKSAASLKPYKDFPLTPHRGAKQWCKKHRGHSYYFGPLDDWEGALKRFNREWKYIIKGETPPPVETEDGDGCELMVLCNAFLRSKRAKLEAAELSERTLRDYRATTDRLIDHFGKHRTVEGLRPNDFDGFRKRLSARLGPVSLKNEVNRVRVVFKYAVDSDLIDKPVRYGQSFDRPSAKVLRKVRNDAGPRLYERHELLMILDALDGKPIDVEGEEKPVKLKRDPVLKAMVLLGLNCGFGNTDVASLPQSAVRNGWVEFPRPKTEVPRRVPLWKETVAALKKAIERRSRPKHRADADLHFLTPTGLPWVRTRLKRGSDDQYVTCNAIGVEFGGLLKRLHINGRKGLGFYTLRHQFETQAGESKDQVAVDAIMGHVDNSMAGAYREGISDERLRAVVDQVRDWLWPESE